MSEWWIRVHANLHAKPVVDRASRALGVSDHEAMGLLVQFWGAASQFATDGNVAAISDRQLERWADWRGEPGKFATFVRGSHTDVTGRINEWEEYAGALEDRREYDRERKRKERERKKAEREQEALNQGAPQDVRGTSDGSPPEVPVTSAPTIRDVTRRTKGGGAPGRSRSNGNGEGREAAGIFAKILDLGDGRSLPRAGVEALGPRAAKAYAAVGGAARFLECAPEKRGLLLHDFTQVYEGLADG